MPEFQLYSKPPEELFKHPLFSGGVPVGIIALDHPQGTPQLDEALLVMELDDLGLYFQRTSSKYQGLPERSYIVYGPTREQVISWAQGLAQQSAIFSVGGHHELIDLRTQLVYPDFDVISWSLDQPPRDNYTFLPGFGFIRLYFNKETPTNVPLAPLKKSHHHHKHHSGGGGFGANPQTPGVPDASGWAQAGLRSIFTGLGGAHHLVSPQEEEPKAEHRHAPEWHDGSTDHHQSTLGHGTLTNRSWFDGRLHKSEVSTGPIDYDQIAQPYGNITEQPNDLEFYSLEGKSKVIDSLIQSHRFQVQTTQQRPDFGRHNYNTHGLVVDVNPEDESQTNWRKLHELAHGLTHQEINQQFGEGRRVGKLGIDLTVRDALRAVTWEWLAMHRQRQLLNEIGVPLSDDLFNQDLNTVMHDSVHRVITGKVPDAEQKGFQPYQHFVPLSVALNLINDASQRVGLNHPHELQKSVTGIPKSFGQHLLNNHAAKGGHPMSGTVQFEPHAFGHGFKIHYQTKTGATFSHDTNTGETSARVQLFTNSPTKDHLGHDWVARNHPNVHKYLQNAARAVQTAHDVHSEF